MAVLAENTSLEEVGFDDCSMEEVKPGVLSSAVSDLGKVHLENLTTTGEQMTAFFSSATSHCKLSSLIVAEVDLSGVAPDLLSTAAKLMELYMNNILLTPEQTRVLWTAIEEESNFSSFQFAGVNLANVNLEALAKVARRTRLAKKIIHILQLIVILNFRFKFRLQQSSRRLWRTPLSPVFGLKLH